MNRTTRRLRIFLARNWHRLNAFLARNATILGAWASLVTIIGLPLLLMGGYTTYKQLRGYLDQPDIALAFATPKEVRFWLLNPSSVLVREPQYSFGLWDLDARAEGQGADPGNLQIPVKSLEYIRPKSAIGPWTVASLSPVGSAVPTGHVVFGWLSVQCPDCKVRRHYWFLWKKGELAWYSEIPFPEESHIMPHLTALLNAGRNYPLVLASIVPQERRIAVADAG